MLAFSLANALAVAALVAGALTGLSAPVLALLGAVAGATVPLVGPLARTRLLALARRAGAPEPTVGAALSFEGTLDELSFVLGPALVGLAAVLAHPAYALAGAALLVATCGTGFALHPTARAVRPGPQRARAATAARAPMPRSARALCAALALQGAMFGACQAGIDQRPGRRPGPRGRRHRPPRRVVRPPGGEHGGRARLRHRSDGPSGGLPGAARRRPAHTRARRADGRGAGCGTARGSAAVRSAGRRRRSGCRGPPRGSAASVTNGGARSGSLPRWSRVRRRPAPRRPPAAGRTRTLQRPRSPFLRRAAAAPSDSGPAG
ncbi:hypothetical protein FB157_13094 [Streptomyces sp. BK340]|nr:hypothetical protein FB157_13094 [Streptomyces sp. BK340]